MSVPHHPSEGKPSLCHYTDGSCEPVNPGGYACWAWLAVGAQGQTIHEAYGCLGHGEGMTNNLAEATAVLHALEWAGCQGYHGFTLYTDSQLIVNQALGRWRVNAPHLKPVMWQIQALLRAHQATIAWIPREENWYADLLTHRAYAEARKAVRHA